VAVPLHSPGQQPDLFEQVEADAVGPAPLHQPIAGRRGKAEAEAAHRLAKEAALALRVAGKLEKGIGITVNCVTPGLIETDMVVTIPPYLLADIVERVPMHRMVQPEEIARVVCFLAQDSSGYITGQIWDVDGGLNM